MKEILQKINDITLDIEKNIKRGEVDKLILEVALDDNGNYKFTKESKQIFDLLKSEALL